MALIKIKFRKICFRQFLSLASALLCFFIFDFFSPQSTSAQPKLDFKEITVPKIGTIRYVELGELAEFLNIRTFYSSKARKVVLYVGDSEVKVTAMNSFIQINDRMIQLPIDTQCKDDDILVPLPHFTDLLRPIYPGSWPELLGAPQPVIAKRNVNITKISAEEKTNGTLVRIRANRRFSSKHITSRFSNRWMYIDIVGGIVAPDAVVPLTNKNLVRNIAPVQVGSVAQISIELQQTIDPDLVTINAQEDQIWVSIPTQEVVPTSILQTLAKDREKWLIDTIVIDPGHGGRDPGAIGPDGSREKDITLQVAKLLKQLVQDELDLNVIMTRDKDVFIGLDDRTRLANSEQGKLFISLHCNANKSRRVRGTTTYFLGQAKTDEALDVALRENSVVKYETDSSLNGMSEDEFILTAMAQNAFNHESEELAAMVQEEMKTHVGLRDRGVHQAGFRVLIGSSMPNILVEMAFISNPNECSKLRSKTFQQNTARAILKQCQKIQRKI